MHSRVQEEGPGAPVWGWAWARAVSVSQVTGPQHFMFPTDNWLYIHFSPASTAMAGTTTLRQLGLALSELQILELDPDQMVYIKCRIYSEGVKII